MEEKAPCGGSYYRSHRCIVLIVLYCVLWLSLTRYNFTLYSFWL